MAKKLENMGWRDLEKLVQEKLNELKKVSKLNFYRLTDSKAAGNLVQQVPADFSVTFRGHHLFIEAKFSEVADSLSQCFANVKTTQLAHAYLERRAGGSYWILFGSAVSQHFEVWSGTTLHALRSNGKRISHSYRDLVTKDFDEAMRFMLSNKSCKVDEEFDNESKAKKTVSKSG